MRLLPRFSAWPALALALGGLLADARPAAAAWDNVFQVCCNSCGGRSSFFGPRTSYYVAPSVSYYAAPSVSYYAAPACPTCPTACPTACAPACPQPVARVSYVQRCYYQPVTEYQRQSYYVPVTQNVTSYYYEQVTSYRYTTYYDPCTGCPQRVCQPCTSYALRSQCNAVTSYVQRCALVPVTTLKPVTVQQPVVSYYYPEPACPAPCPTAACPTADCPSGNCSSSALPSTPPSVEQIRQNTPSVMPEKSADTIPPTEVPTKPNAYPKYLPPPTNTPSNVRMRPERTAGFDGLHVVRGEVLKNDQTTPRPNAKLVFVSGADISKRQFATANAFGEFEVKLKAGDWYLYVESAEGKATYHKKLTLGDRDSYLYKLVSR